MRKIADTDRTVLIKYMIELGIRKIDIIYCFVKHGIPAHEALLLMEVLTNDKEIIKDKKNELYLTHKLPPIPKHIAKMIRDCMEKVLGGEPA